MRNRNGNRPSRRGFTIIELLVVISIMAVIATLATGAALKAVKQSRNKRVDATCKALEVALMNYRAQENEWPFDKGDLTRDPDHDGRPNIFWAHGEDNVRVFKPLYHSSKGGSSTVYLDASALMAESRGKRKTLQKFLNEGNTDVSLMYPDPDDSRHVNYYCVEFNQNTDSVKVHSQRSSDHDCPKKIKY